MSEQAEITRATIVIVGKEQVQTQTGRTYLKVSSNSQGIFSVWDQDLWPKIPPSGVLAIEYKTKGDYRSIVGVANGTQPTPTPTPAPVDNRQWSITRQTALKCAVDFCREPIDPSHQVALANIEDCLAVAARFHSWLLADADGEIPF